jgi:autophagy-related protein 13
VSASSSPGKPLSPHTPHTPAIPSRLSENSIIDYATQAQGVRRAARTAPEISATEEEAGHDAPVSQEGATAIDIPLSPRLLHTNRRASSVAQQHRAMIEDDDSELPFGGLRSISLGADEREPPTPSALLGIGRESGGDTPSLQPAADIRASPAPPSASPAEKNPPSALLASSPYRLRYSQSRRGRPTPPQSGRGSFVGSSAGRYELARGDNEADDEPLVFDLSELGRDLGRRSLEEGRGGGSVGSGSAERGGFEAKGVSRRGW